MRIENIAIRNYRLFQEAKLTSLPPLAVVVGANGTRKSTLFDVFTFHALLDAIERLSAAGSSSGADA